MKLNRIIQHAVYVPEHKQYYKSGSLRDYVHIDFPKDKKYFYIDGGSECSRSGGDFDLIKDGRIIDFSLYEKDPFEKIVKRFLWGTYGKSGTGKFKWVLLVDCDTDHLKAILETQIHIRGGIIEKIVKHILKERNE